MTELLRYPDVSAWQAGIPLTGLDVVSVKGTEGNYYTNPDYARVARDADAGGVTLIPYHFLRPSARGGSMAEQAAYFYRLAGSRPAMIDAESELGSGPSVAEAVEFARRLRVLGGRPRLLYLPRWYWLSLGSPDLTPVSAAGLLLVNADYTGPPEGSPGWNLYGRVAPVALQYTDRAPVNGRSVDMNAFPGSLADFRRLLLHGKDQENMFFVRLADRPEVFLSNGLTARWLSPQALADFATLAGEGRVNIPQTDVRVVTDRAVIGQITGTVPAGYEDLAH